MRSNEILRLFCFGLLVAISGSVADAQNDALFRIGNSGKVSKLTGKIKGITPLSIAFEGRSGSVDIPVWEVEKISAKDEPSAVDRTRRLIEDGQIDDAIKKLDSIEKQSNPVTATEIAFLRAVANSQIALTGGSVSAADAAREMTRFLKDNPRSHHVIPARSLLGKLAMEAGELDFAKQQFSELAESKWPEYEARGLFQSGEVLIRQEKYNEAALAFDNTLKLSANDSLTQRIKLLSRCQKAKAEALASGSPDESIKALEQIIKQENPDDKELFAYAYNALGTCYLKSDDLAEAAEKFLFTHLLFDTESTLHAEAVYQLAKIWSQQQRTDRAATVKQILKTRYRNTWWANKQD